MTSTRLSSYVCLYCALVIWVAHAAYSEAAQPDAEAAERNTGLLSPQDILQKIEPVALLLELPPLECLDERTTLTGKATGLCFEVEVANKPKGIRFRVDDVPGPLRSFHTGCEAVLEDLPRTAAIDAKAIVPRANVFLKEVGIDMTAGEKDLTLNAGSGAPGLSLRDAQWVFEQVYSDDRIPAEAFRVRLSFSAYTGRITDFTYRPASEASASQEGSSSSEEGKEQRA